MRFLRQAARRAAVLLLCLSMLTGMLIPAFAATVDPAAEMPEPTAATAFTVNAAGSITKYTGSDDRIVIPKAIDGKNIIATGPVSLYDTNKSLIVDCAVASENFTRSPFDVYPYDLNDKALFARYEAYGTDDDGYPIYKVWLTDDGVSGGSGETEDGYVVALIYAGATPEFRYGTETPTEPVVLTVYEQDEGGEAKEVKSYKPSELAALATEGAAGYQFWKKGEAQLVAATQYVTMNDLLTDAGITFADLDTLTAAAADGFSSELTYADNETYRYYITEDGKTEVPAILALTWASGSGTLEEVAAAAKNTGSLRFCYGISEQQYADQSAAGKRLASNIATITVVHGAKAEEPWVNPFRDVTESDWFYDDVRFANQNGLFNGVEKDLFAPNTPMTRGMLVTVLWRLDGETAPKAAATFTDVDVNAYYADAVAWAAEVGVVNGIGGNRFDPEGNVTREQIAAILFRYASLKGVDTAARADLAVFPDAEKTSAYAHDALSWAVAAELVKGTKEGSAIYLDPQGSAARAQVAAILSRYAQNIVK